MNILQRKVGINTEGYTHPSESSKETSFYEHILSGDRNSLKDVVEWVRGYDFGQESPTIQKLSNMDYKETVNGIDIYYNFGTDNYMFAIDI